MPTGRFNWAISPMTERATRQRKGKWEKKEDEKMRNKDVLRLNHNLLNYIKGFSF